MKKSIKRNIVFIVLSIIGFFIVVLIIDSQRSNSVVLTVLLFGIIIFGIYSLVGLIIALFKRKEASDINTDKLKVDSDVPSKFRNGLKGYARNIAKQEMSLRKKMYMGFRLERTDDVGNIIEECTVELVAGKIQGALINDGDNLIVKGKKDSRGVIKPSTIYNINTKTIIKGKKPFIVKLLQFLLYAAIIIVIVFLIIVNMF